jgi:putative membrane protein
MMIIRNILGGSAVLFGVMAFAPTLHAASLSSPDSDALVAGYQVIHFDTEECSAIAHSSSTMSASGNSVISPDILKVSVKICADARAFSPELERVAKEKGFDLPPYLPYTLTARYAALVRNDGSNTGVKYLNDQISSHEDALAIFQNEAANGTDPDIKAAAAKVIPIVQSNLELLKETLAKHS